jgi:hypothetical protein
VSGTWATQDDIDAWVLASASIVTEGARQKAILLFLTCKHCRCLLRDHANGKCLFDSTRYEACRELPPR